MTNIDVLNAYNFTMKAAENADLAAETHRRIRDIVVKNALGEGFVNAVLGRKLGLER